MRTTQVSQTWICDKCNITTITVELTSGPNFKAPPSWKAVSITDENGFTNPFDICNVCNNTELKIKDISDLLVADAASVNNLTPAEVPK